MPRNPSADDVDPDRPPELWITYRGDASTCNPDHTQLDDWRCHDDNPAKYNKVFIHLSFDEDDPWLIPKTEKWYWLSAGEVYSTPSGGVTIAACEVGFGVDNAATVKFAVCGRPQAQSNRRQTGLER